MTDGFWWKDPEGDAHQAIFAYVQGLEQRQAYVARRAEAHASLYANREFTGGRDTGMPRQFAVTENVIASCVDTATAMIARSRVRATFQTDGADWSLAQRAKRLEHFTEAQFDALHIYDVAQAAFRDACIYGTGGIKVIGDDGDIVVERVVMGPVCEIIVDEEACNNCEPLELFQRKFVDKEVLAELYPEHAEDIRSCPPGYEPYSLRQEKPNQVAVVMAWRLPARKGGAGRYVECIRNCTLVDREYKKDHFPFVWYRWSQPLTGFYGQGLAEALVGIQLRLNKLNKFITRCQDLIANPRVFGNFGAKGPSARIDNEIGSLINTRDGKPPTFYTPQAVGNEIYQEREYLFKRAFELTGISQLSATSKKPSGVEAAVAMRELTDIESQRFAPQAQRYERMFCDLARLLIETGKEVYKGSEAKQVYKAKRYVETIPWSDVDPKEDVYLIDVEAASTMSRTPAGRLSAVVEMSQAGLIDTEEGRKLLDHPDLRRTNDLYNAAHDDIEAVIESLLAGKYEAPEPMQDLGAGIKHVQMAYLKARRDGAPEDVLDLMRRWMSAAGALMQQAAPPPPTPQATTPMAAVAQQGAVAV